MKIEYVHASKYGNGARVAQGQILVTGLKGPLQEGWQKKVEAFASQVSRNPGNEASRTRARNLSILKVCSPGSASYPACLFAERSRPAR